MSTQMKVIEQYVLVFVTSTGCMLHKYFIDCTLNVQMKS